MHHRLRRGRTDDAVQGQVGPDGADRATVGLFTYPILQAADILLYDADRVPVGEDQRQHLELTRDLAQRFNSRYGETFAVPEPYIVKATAKITDLQRPDKKMSKSSAAPGCLYLLDDPKVSAKKIRSAVTDAGREIVFDPEAQAGRLEPAHDPVRAVRPPIADLEERFAGAGYGDLKKEVESGVPRLRRAVPGRGCRAGSPTRPRWTTCWPTAPRGPGSEASARLADVYEKVGFLGAGTGSTR